MVSELLGFVVSYLSLILETSQPLYLQIHQSFSSSGIPNYDISTTDTNPQLTGALSTVTFSVF